MSMDVILKWYEEHKCVKCGSPRLDLRRDGLWQCRDCGEIQSNDLLEIHEIGLRESDVAGLIRMGLLKSVMRSNKSHYVAINWDAYERWRSAETPRECLITRELLDKFVYGYEEEKELVMKLNDAQVHLLLVGPPASGKTQFLEALASLPCSVMTMAASSTRAGLEELLFGNPLYLLIDELEKVKDARDLDVLLGVMWGGKLRINKSGRHVEMSVRTRVVAAANSLRGLRQALLSRFAVIEFKEYTKEEYINIVKWATERDPEARRAAERDGGIEKRATEVAETMYKRGIRDVRKAIIAIKLGKGTENKIK